MWVSLRMNIPSPLNDLASRRAFVNVANEIGFFMRVDGGDGVHQVVERLSVAQAEV